MTIPQDPRPELPSPRDRPPGMPTWVKASVVVAVVVVLAVIAVMLLSGGEHGPGRHLGGAAPADAVVVADART